MDNSTKVLNFIEEYLEEYGFPPSVREVCQELGFSSTSSAQYYIKKLEKQGLIKLSGAKNRAISLTDKNKRRAIYVPEVGTVTAGTPILAVENLVGYCPLPEDFSTDDDVFALRVSGLSMINAGIYDGDKIIVKKTSTCSDGDIVVALVDDSATVKRFYKKDKRIILHPENETFSDIVLDDVFILGVVIGLIRKF